MISGTDTLLNESMLNNSQLLTGTALMKDNAFDFEEENVGTGT
jgi:hypothetical protein